MKKLSLLLLIGISLFACDDDTILPDDPDQGGPDDEIVQDEEVIEDVDVSEFGSQNDLDLTDDQYANAWIHDQMTLYYLWNNQLPDKELSDEAPEDYFESLLSDEDRFSVIRPNYDELVNSLNGVSTETGYFFDLRRVGDSDDVEAVVMYVKPNSPAEEEGLQRGDMIHTVNGTLMTLDNYRTVVYDLYEQQTIAYERFVDGARSEMPSVSITPVEYSENPILMNKVIELDGGQKVGYMVYNFFSNGGSNENYNDQVDEVFEGFKSEGVTELVLDLRYNGGGSINSATNLASLIAPNVTENSVFYSNVYNTDLTAYLESEDISTTGYFQEESANLGLDHLYVLTTRFTASASELVINGLNPYMEVTQIGTKTVGKNVGSITIQDEENESNDYGLLPIILKISNSEGFSDYADGFTPQAGNEIQEMSYEQITPLGDEAEPLLERALVLIEGGTSLPARVTATVDDPSLDFDARRNTNLILNR